jgi:hypothetical protein
MERFGHRRENRVRSYFFNKTPIFLPPFYIALNLRKETIMQKKTLKTTAFVLCLCILLLAVPSTFARNGNKTIKFESRFHFNFVKPAELLNGIIWSILPPPSDHTTVTAPPDKNTPSNGQIKTTGGASKSHASTGD